MKRTKKYPQRRVLTNPDHDQEQAFYAATDHQAPLQGRQCIAGTVEYPPGTWQVWYSTNGLDVNLAAAASTEQEAEALRSALKGLLRGSLAYSDEELAARIKQLEVSGNVKPQPLPDSIMRQSGRAIQHEIAMME